MKHILDTEALKEWQNTQKVVFASSSKESKKLYCTLNGYYQVYRKEEKIIETKSPGVAVKIYNEI